MYSAKYITFLHLYFNRIDSTTLDKWSVLESDDHIRKKVRKLSSLLVYTIQLPSLSHSFFAKSAEAEEYTNYFSAEV